MRHSLLILSLCSFTACATASQRAADEQSLRDQQTHATPLRHPFEQLDGHIAADPLGGRYQLISATSEELCFRSLIPSENGNEQLVSFYLSAIDPDGTIRTVHHKSLLQLGLSQQTTLNAGTDAGGVNDASHPGAGVESSIGRNQSGSSTDSGTASLGGHTTKTAPPVITTATDAKVDPVMGSDDYTRVRTYAAMNVCFPAQPTLGRESQFMVMQRGDLGLMNPHPLRAVWKLAPIASVVQPVSAPHRQHADPFAPAP